jgi:putative cell wall-binding protein
LIDILFVTQDQNKRRKHYQGSLLDQVQSEPAIMADATDFTEINGELEAASEHAKAKARFQNEYSELEQQKTHLEKQNNPNIAKRIGRIAMRMQELKLMMEEADLKATLLSGDSDDTKIKQTTEDLDKKKEELIKHREQMANTGAGAGKK